MNILNKIRTNKILLRLTLLCCVLLMLIFVRELTLLVQRMISEPVLIEIQAGSSTGQIARLLKEEKVIDSAIWFNLQVRLRGAAPNLKAGLYLFKPGTHIAATINKLVNGEVEEYEDIRITIPEGYNIKQIGLLFEENGLFSAEEFYQKVQEIDLPYEWAKDLPDNLIWKYEGYLFPDTYDFKTVTTVETVVKKMAARFETQVNQVYQDSGIEEYTLHQLLTLASVIEKEAVLDDERPTIASVFYNRIKIGQPLQSCATVQYVLPVHREVLTIEDTQVDSVFNTYRHLGLPPGPISSVGSASFMATIEPANTGYYYFNAIGGGKHYFSKTYQEHLNAIKRYK